MHFIIEWGIKKSKPTYRNSALNPYVECVRRPIFPPRQPRHVSARFSVESVLMSDPAALSASSASLVFLAAAVIAVPLFRFAGLSAVLGYLLAGLAIGPSGFGLFNEPNTLRSIAELGIVMFLFVIGLELKPSKLLSMRRDILGITGYQRRLEFFRMEMGDSPSRWQRVKNLWAAEKHFFLSNLTILAVTAAAGVWWA